ncbi:hypothetical protein T484DRAFT_1917665, partial [Baffinella frigidus]
MSRPSQRCGVCCCAPLKGSTRARGPPPTSCVTVRVSPRPYAGCTPTPRYPSIYCGASRSRSAP